MSLCAVCGLRPPADVGLCPHHHIVYGGHDWSSANRIMCDFFHRQRAPQRLTKPERADDVDAITVTLDAGDDVLRTS